jgi:hypothetical protein
MAESQKKDALQRLKVLIDSSTPIIVIETVEKSVPFAWYAPPAPP